VDAYSVVEGLEPQSVFRYFIDLSKQPRQPGKRKPCSDYLVSFAKSLGLPYEQDDYQNVIIRKPASKGYESAPSVMLQAHFDMICEKEEGLVHDFDRDQVKVVRQGDHICAEGTTLGADNGVGCAYMMAILADNSLVHPALECVFTSDEESDMGGAAHLKRESVQSRLIINLDETAVKVCHPGTLKVDMVFDRETEEVLPGRIFRKLTVGGLIGGHTGGYAMAERGNAIVLLNRVLWNLRREMDFQLLSMEGGTSSPSVFAREASAVIAFDPPAEAALLRVVEQMQALYKKELKVNDPGVSVCLTEAEGGEEALSAETAATLLELLLILPDGVFSMNKEHAGHFETCSNIGVLRTKGEQVFASLLIRAITAEKKYYLYDKIVALCDLLNVRTSIGRDLPHWEEQPASKLMEIVREVYTDREPSMSACSLECGYFQAKWPDAEIVVLGSPYYNAHSPSEYFSIEETKYYWDHLLEVLRRIH